MLDDLVSAYLDAKDCVISSGYAEELDWQEERSFYKISESIFLREAAWVILSSGMRDSVVRNRFPLVSKAFYNWASASQIMSNGHVCRKEALRVFRNDRKINAILKIASIVSDVGFPGIKQRINQEGISFIKRLPFMGPATSYHLAKNLGMDVVKPDRHLVRIAIATNHNSPYDMCRRIAERTGEKLSVVDLVIWRYATLNKNYLDHFTSGRFSFSESQLRS